MMTGPMPRLPLTLHLFSELPTFTFSKDDGGSIASPSDLIVYTLRYSNTANVGATNVIITETVPANTTF